MAAWITVADGLEHCAGHRAECFLSITLINPAHPPETGGTLCTMWMTPWGWVLFSLSQRRRWKHSLIQHLAMTSHSGAQLPQQADWTQRALTTLQCVHTAAVTRLNYGTRGCLYFQDIFYLWCGCSLPAPSCTSLPAEIPVQPSSNVCRNFPVFIEIRVTY